MIRKCVECGKEFKCSPSDKTITCSKECRGIRRSRLLTGKKHSIETKAKKSAAAKKRDNSANLSRGTEVAKRSPKAGRFETNSSAKRWIIISPDNVVYKCTNLREFIRRHGELFCINGDDDKQVDRIESNFIVLKGGVKKGTRETCNGGWRIRLGYDDKCNFERKS